MTYEVQKEISHAMKAGDFGADEGLVKNIIKLFSSAMNFRLSELECLFSSLISQICISLKVLLSSKLQQETLTELEDSVQFGSSLR